MICRVFNYGLSERFATLTTRKFDVYTTQDYLGQWFMLAPFFLWFLSVVQLFERKENSTNQRKQIQHLAGTTLPGTCTRKQGFLIWRGMPYLDSNRMGFPFLSHLLLWFISHRSISFSRRCLNFSRQNMKKHTQTHTHTHKKKKTKNKKQNNKKKINKQTNKQKKLQQQQQQQQNPYYVGVLSNEL